MSMGENAKKVFNMPSFVAYLSFHMLMQVVALCKGSRPRKIFEQHFRIERRIAPIIGRLRDRLDLAYRLQLCGAAIRVLRSAQESNVRGDQSLGEQRSALGAISDSFKEGLVARAAVSVGASLCSMGRSQESLVRRGVLVGLSLQQKEECKSICARLLTSF